MGPVGIGESVLIFVNNIIVCIRHLLKEFKVRIYLSFNDSHLDCRHFSFKTSEGMEETNK